MPGKLDIDDIILNFDPAAPQQRFRTVGLEAAFAPVAAALPGAIPWPENATPKAAPLAVAPAETDDLSRFHGYDAVVVTWTAAEASALAALFTPEHPTATWYEYRHNIASYIPLVTGGRAPFNVIAHLGRGGVGWDRLDGRLSDCVMIVDVITGDSIQAPCDARDRPQQADRRGEGCPHPIAAAAGWTVGSGAGADR